MREPQRVKIIRKVTRMNDKGHFYISLAKSIIRIGGCAYGLIKGKVKPVALMFLLAEGLGIAEELADRT